MRKILILTALALSACNTMPAAVLDATLPPPSEISPLAQTQIDDRAVVAAFAALDLAATAADTMLAIKPSFAGTPAAIRLADGLVGAKTWLNIASKAQRAGQATSYTAALEQAAAALAGAQSAMFDLRKVK